MLAASLDKTPHAAISRAYGRIGPEHHHQLRRPASVQENLAAVLPALPHAFDKLHGDPADCGG